jgi:HD superfamily phosphohydrolase
MPQRPAAVLLSALLLARAGARTITDAIHRSIPLHPLCARLIDTPEFQRLRTVGQLGACRWVFPGGVHDRFQHSIGVAHLARAWAEHFRREQPYLGLTDADVLCVTLAGLTHDLGHGPLSHFWEGEFLPAAGGGGGAGAAGARPPAHEELSCAILDRLLARNTIDVSPWLAPGDVEFVKALVRGAPPPRGAGTGAGAAAMRLGEAGVAGSDKAFLYQIVANQASGLDVDKLDYFSRDCHFAGVVKLSFDTDRLRATARVARAAGGGGGGRLQICWPDKCLPEVLQVFQTRFLLHTELYQHRVTAAVSLMLRDALLAADAGGFRVYGADGAPLRLAECGSDADAGLDGYLQLGDGLIAQIVAEARRRSAAERRADGAGGAGGADGADGADGAPAERASADGLGPALALLERVERRELYRFVGSVLVGASAPPPARVIEELCARADGALQPDALRADVRHVHYGRKAHNPVDGVRFFANKAEGGGAAADDAPPRARVMPSSTYAARLPGAFEERSVRVWVVDDSALAAARRAFDAWCEEQRLCNDECLLNDAGEA